MKCFRGIYNIFEGLSDFFDIKPQKSKADLMREVAEDVEFEEIEIDENRKTEEPVKILE